MKRDPIPTIEQLSQELPRRIDLSPLGNRLAGKSLVGFEHCLIEVLGELFETQKEFASAISELAQDAKEQHSDRSAFMRAYNLHERERGNYAAKYANFSVIGKFFNALLARLCDLEDKQDRSGSKPVTVGHARQLAAIICTQLERMFAQGQRRNTQLDQLWDVAMQSGG